MPNPSLRADCARCAALCCVAHAFDRSESFAFDKPADVACHNLGARHRCTIHDRLSDSGFGGCVTFDCAGAGQVVTQEMFGGRSWRDDPALLPAMMEAFRILRRVHELRLLLSQARALPIEAGTMRTLESLAQALEPDDGWTLATLRMFVQGSLAADIHSFLKSLGPANRRLRRQAHDRPSDAAA